MHKNSFDFLCVFHKHLLKNPALDIPNDLSEYHKTVAKAKRTDKNGNFAAKSLILSMKGTVHTNMTEYYKPEGFRIDTPENREHLSMPGAIECAIANGSILEARATLCDAAHNLIVETGSFRGIIPRSEAAYSTNGDEIRDIAVITRVGKPVCFTVIGVDKTAVAGAPRYILSRRAAQAKCYKEYISTLKSGDIIDAKITHIEPFGCFCDIGCGIISLLPVDCISVSRIRHPGERFSAGDMLRCVVRTNDRELGRISLSHKELLGTWEQNAARFSAGETAAGIIRSTEPYGIFVELAPNLAGLAEWCEGACVGKAAAVYIKSILPEKMKIKLVIIDAHLPALPPAKPQYFIDADHIDFWRYSPENCEKEIFTDFSGETP